MRSPILERLATEVLVGDGAMGTMLMAAGAVSRNTSEANLTHPDLVSSAHRAYRRAGAHLLQTNTFAANPIMLKTAGLADQGPQIWSSAVQLCREAAGDDLYVAADLGPTGALLEPLGELSAEEARSSFLRQCEAMLGPSVDMVLLESFETIEEVELAVSAVRELDPHIPLAVTMSFSVGQGRTSMGVDGGTAAQRLSELAVDILGANCGTPQALETAFAQMSEHTDRPLMAQPNAGLPTVTGGRTVWSGTALESGQMAARLIACGARIVGGCCGTTPDHLLQVARAASAKA